jgi:predicted 2-oxoglutarate/Fe(II)-dependent dioxygenase YbiX
MEHNIIKIDSNDINLIKKVYKNGEENVGDTETNEYNKRYDKNIYNTKVIKSETFFCDTRNKELVNILKKYIILNEKTEYISNIHYINYKIGEEAKEHFDTGPSIRTYIILLNDEFEGGEFYLENNYIDLKIGEMLEFDANLLHSVKPIQKGNREVMVIWILNSQKNKKTII